LAIALQCRVLMSQPKDPLLPPRYEIRIVAGQLDSAAAAALAGLNVVSDGTLTVVTGEFDQAALHGLLERIRSLDLELFDVRRARGFSEG
jgi:hypothetical protein